MGSRLAYDLMKNVISQIDFGVDFHTGGAKINNYPQIRCVFEDERNIELSNAFSAPFVLNAPYREKSLRREAAKKGKHILVFEGGESQRFNSYSINEGLNGCLRMLNKLGMIDTPVEKCESIILRDTTWIRAKTSGMFRTGKKFGAFVEKDSMIGKIVSPFGEKETFLFTPSDGFLIGINNQPIVNEGDALMNIGVE
jgi:predicted deacylase